MSEKLLSPGDEWRLSVAGRTQRELDAERRRGKALADAVRQHLRDVHGGHSPELPIAKALAAWDSQ